MKKLHTELLRVDDLYPIEYWPWRDYDYDFISL